MSYYSKRNRHIQATAIGSSKEDRLSALPESIIVDILSLLPLRSVIVTSVLSHQWHHLWTQIHSVDIHYTELKPLDSKYNLINIIHHVLQKLKSLRKFHATLGDHSHSSICMLHSWFRQICAQKVEVISVSSNCKAQLPSFVFQTKSLVVLEIDKRFWFDLPAGKDWEVDVKLPRLKKLKLTRFEGDPKCVEHVVNSCPLLEEFFLEVAEYIVGYDVVVYFSSHNLKVLDLVFSYHLDSKFVINAPKLEYFSAGSKGYYKDSRFTFVENHTSLLGARIWRKNHLVFPELLELSSNTLKTMSHVKFLELDFVAFKPFTELGFPNLTRLDLRWPLHHHMTALVKFLCYCPALEVLVLNIAAFDEVKQISSSCSPTCLQTRLKKIEVNIEEGIQHHYKILINIFSYLLQNSKVLQQLTFRIDNTYDGENKDILTTQSIELKFCEELFSLPRSSLRCQINFVGECHKASSNDVV